jgi:hypothetical protein
MELTIEEMEMEEAEYLPDREVMCSPCYNPCFNPCGCAPSLSISVELCVRICL